MDRRDYLIMNEIISLSSYAIGPQRISPPLNVKVLASCPGDASMRQALEAVIIRKEDPPLKQDSQKNED